MALTNAVVHGDVTAHFLSFANEGLSTSNITSYIAAAFTVIGNMLRSERGVDPDTIDADHSSRFNMAIIYKTLELIFEDLRPRNGEDDRYKERQEDYERRFETAWQAIEYDVDTDGDDEADTPVKHTGTLNVSRG